MNNDMYTIAMYAGIVWFIVSGLYWLVRNNILKIILGLIAMVALFVAVAVFIAANIPDSNTPIKIGQYAGMPLEVLQFDYPNRIDAIPSSTRINNSNYLEFEVIVHFAQGENCSVIYQDGRLRIVIGNLAGTRTYSLSDTLSLKGITGVIFIQETTPLRCVSP